MKKMKNVVILMHYTGAESLGEVQQFCMTYGYTLCQIDTTGTLVSGGNVYSSLDDMLADVRFKGWTWTFFDPTVSTDTLSKANHQRDKEIYAFGPDDGWDRPLDQLPGALVGIDTALGDGFEHTAPMCAAAVMIHRYYQVDV